MKTLLLTELRLFRREPGPAFWGMVFPVALLIVLGSTVGNKPDVSLGGVGFITVFTPVMTVFSLGLLSLSSLPSTLAGYRDKGYLRRLSTTPVGAWRMLAAQLIIVACLAAAVIVVITLVSHFAFGGDLAQNFGGWLLTIVLLMSAMLSFGLLIASLAPTGKIANVAGSMSFFVLMFFAGLWVPQAAMGSTLRTIAHYTPLGAGVPAIQNAAAGLWPGTNHLLVLVGYTIVLALLAGRFFRWE
ncbi:MAG: ABC transporter permease [Solirubrobacterales bacterium]|nr:ABC transporter permease [Solirubrobacterales bacterium]